VRALVSEDALSVERLLEETSDWDKIDQLLKKFEGAIFLNLYLSGDVNTPSMESMVVTNVKMSNNNWSPVNLTKIYWSPIAVCTVKYDTGTDLLPGVVRMKNVLPESFKIRISNPKGFSS
jgi:hypothetical protein